MASHHVTSHQVTSQGVLCAASMPQRVLGWPQVHLAQRARLRGGTAVSAAHAQHGVGNVLAAALCNRQSCQRQLRHKMWPAGHRGVSHRCVSY